MNCQEFVDALIAGEPAPEIDTHLSECADCSERHQVVARLRSASRELAAQPAFADAASMACRRPAAHARPIWIAAAAAAVLALAVPGVWMALDSTRVVPVARIEGDLARPENPTLPLAPVSDAVPSGPLAAIGRGARVVTREGADLSFAPGAEFNFESAQTVSLLQGEVECRISLPSGSPAPFRVRVPGGQVEATGTHFRVRIMNQRISGTVAIAVFAGSVAFAADSGRREAVSEGMLLRLPAWTMTSIQDGELEELIEKLGAEEYLTREASEKRLVELGKDNLPRLKKAQEEAKDAEVRTRLERIVAKLEGREPAKPAPDPNRNPLPGTQNSSGLPGGVPDKLPPLEYKEMPRADDLKGPLGLEGELFDEVRRLFEHADKLSEELQKRADEMKKVMQNAAGGNAPPPREAYMDYAKAMNGLRQLPDDVTKGLKELMKEDKAGKLDEILKQRREAKKKRLDEERKKAAEKWNQNRQDK